MHVSFNFQRTVNHVLLQNTFPKLLFASLLLYKYCNFFNFIYAPRVQIRKDGSCMVHRTILEKYVKLRSFQEESLEIIFKFLTSPVNGVIFITNDKNINKREVKI